MQGATVPGFAVPEPRDGTENSGSAVPTESPNLFQATIRGGQSCKSCDPLVLDSLDPLGVNSDAVSDLLDDSFGSDPNGDPRRG